MNNLNQSKTMYPKTNPIGAERTPYVEGSLCELEKTIGAVEENLAHLTDRIDKVLRRQEVPLPQPIEATKEDGTGVPLADRLGVITRRLSRLAENLNGTAKLVEL